MTRDFSDKKENGFTLIELLISLMVSSIMMALIAGFFVNHRRSHTAQELLVEMTQNARAAMDVMTREVRMAGYNTNDGYTFTAIPYNPAKLQIRANLDGDSALSSANEDVSYTYDATLKMIRRDTGGGGQPFAENIQAFTFTYLDKSGTPVTDAAHEADIRQVRINVTGRTAAVVPGFTTNGGYGKTTVSATVKIRNLGLES